MVLSRTFAPLCPDQAPPRVWSGLFYSLLIPMEVSMKRLALAVGLLVFVVGAAIPARADYGVVRFHGGFCRVWPDTAMAPFGGQYLAFHRYWGGRHWWQYRFLTLAGANTALHLASFHHRCSYINA
jgi:hypothetical protein